jgi:hypothetical protein
MVLNRPAPSSDENLGLTSLIAEGVMGKWYEAANEASFRRVAEGNVFQSPNPWVFARPRYYLVNEAQKAEILAHMGRWRLLTLTFLAITFAIIGSFIAFVTLSPATFSRLVEPALQLGLATFILFISLLMTVLIAPLVAVPQIYLIRGLRPLLADAPRTNETIKVREQLPKIASSVSGKVLALGLVGGLCMIAAAVSNLLDAYFDGLHARNLFFVLPLLIVGGLMTAYFVYLIRLKAELKRTSG